MLAGETSKGIASFESTLARLGGASRSASAAPAEETAVDSSSPRSFMASLTAKVASPGSMARECNAYMERVRVRTQDEATAREERERRRRRIGVEQVFIRIYRYSVTVVLSRFRHGPSGKWRLASGRTRLWSVCFSVALKSARLPVIRTFNCHSSEWHLTGVNVERLQRTLDEKERMRQAREHRSQQYSEQRERDFADLQVVS